MGPWGNIGIGALALACGIMLVIAEEITHGYEPVAWLGFAMAAVGVLFGVIGIIGAGVKSGNEESRGHH